MNDDLEPYFKSILDFFEKSSIDIKPYPKIKLITTEQDGPFAPTGNYRFETKTITLYTGGRHLKDILRSFAHELFHHYQFLHNKALKKKQLDGSLEQNEELEDLEGEAYLNGNLLFRRWTEKFTKY